MNVQREKSLLRHGYAIVLPLLAVFIVAVALVSSATAGTALYYVGCVATVLSFIGACAFSAYTLYKLERLGFVAAR